MILTLSITKALLCAGLQCWPVLVGNDTPVGTFTLTQRYVMSPEYGGDVLKFLETKEDVFSIHRVLHVKGERREERLKDPNPAHRRLTKGCVNVEPNVYDELVRRFSGETLVIEK